MSENKKSLEVVFAPGCFDTFEGSQEELDELIVDIRRMAESGELSERATIVDPDELDELLEDTPELADKLSQFSEIGSAKRNLQ